MPSRYQLNKAESSVREMLRELKIPITEATDLFLCPQCHCNELEYARGEGNHLNCSCLYCGHHWKKK